MDINECEIGVLCSANSICTNQIGGDPGYSCSCEDGYESPTNDGKDCEDIDGDENPKKVTRVI